MGQLDGRVCLVTGAGRGIGAAIATAFAQAGAEIVLTDIHKESVEAHAAALGQSAHVHDVADEAAWIQIVGAVTTRFNRLDVLVNNAGYGWLKPVVDIPLDEWRRLMAVNVDGTFLGMKHAIPLMEKTGGGAIVNMSSMYGKVGNAGTAAYCASKGAVTLMTKAVALECAERRNGIRVNSIHPGYVQTPSVAEALSPAQIEQLRKLHPIGRIADPPEIARAVVFLASEDASFMTGAELVVDGGFTAQ
jgi:NAD(P)-dependent dehydrogenase (short-subunit alcohol dehydrogenase family)